MSGCQIYEPSITKGVVQRRLGLELRSIWRTDDVDDRDMLRKCCMVDDGSGNVARELERSPTSSDTIDSAQFPDTKSEKRVLGMKSWIT